MALEGQFGALANIAAKLSTTMSLEIFFQGIWTAVGKALKDGIYEHRERQTKPNHRRGEPRS